GGMVEGEGRRPAGGVGGELGPVEDELGMVDGEILEQSPAVPEQEGVAVEAVEPVGVEVVEGPGGGVREREDPGSPAGVGELAMDRDVREPGRGPRQG